MPRTVATNARPDPHDRDPDVVAARTPDGWQFWAVSATGDAMLEAHPLREDGVPGLLVEDVEAYAFFDQLFDAGVRIG